MLSAPLKKSPFARPKLLRDASLLAVYDAMKADPAVHLFGEGCEVKVHYDAPAIERDFAERVHTMPISEDGNVNFCVGAALMGVKPICDVISADFLYRAMDSICNTAAKLRGAGPIVIRAEFLLGGPTTGQRPEAMFAHVPGLRVVIPSTPRDAYGLMRTALATPGVTLYFEDRMIEDDGPWEDEDLTGWIPFDVPFGKALVRNLGTQYTIVTYGVMRQRVERIFNANDFRAEMLDLRSVYPLDIERIKDSVDISGRLLVIEPDVQAFGVGAEIVAQIAEQMPHVRVKRLGARRETAPAAPSLHKHFLPTDEEIINAIKSF